MKLKLASIALLLLLTAACAPVVTPAPPSPVPETPAPPATDTPLPPINAPVVPAPALVSIHMFNERHGWGVTEQAVVRTDDGGATWYNLTPPSLTELGYNVAASDFLDPQTAWLLVMDSGDPMLLTQYHTTDGGLTWTSTPGAFFGGDMHFLDAAHGWMMEQLGVAAGSNAVAIHQTNDGGATWMRTYVNDPTVPGAGDSLPLGGLKFGLTPLNMQTAWVGGVIYASGMVYLYRTDDGGRTWAQVSLSLPPGAENAELGFEEMQFVSPADAFLTMRMVADTNQLAVYVSHDGGAAW